MNTTKNGGKNNISLLKTITIVIVKQKKRKDRSFSLKSTKVYMHSKKKRGGRGITQLLYIGHKTVVFIMKDSSAGFQILSNTPHLYLS